MSSIKKLLISIVILSCVGGVFILIGYSLDGDRFIRNRSIDRFGKVKDYDDKTVEKIIENPEEIRINAGFRNIYVQKSKDDNVHLEYNTQGDIETDFENGILEINEYTSIKKQNIGVHVDGIKNLFLYGRFEEPKEDKYYIKLYLPERDLDQLTVVSDVGSIWVEKINSKTIDLSTSCGELTVKNLTSEGIDLSNDVGQIYGENIKAEKMEMKVDYGNCSVKNSEFEDLKINSDVGEVTFHDLIIKNSLSVSTDTGEISGTLKVDKSKFYNIMANSDVGSVKIDSSFNENKKKVKDIVNIHLNSDIGDVSLKAK